MVVDGCDIGVECLCLHKHREMVSGGSGSVVAVDFGDDGGDRRSWWRRRMMVVCGRSCRDIRV